MNYALVPSTGEVPQEALKIAALLGLSPEILAKARQEMGRRPPRGVDGMKLELDAGLAPDCRAAAKKIAADVQSFIESRTTEAVEGSPASPR